MHLQQEGHTVLEAADGQEALAVFARQRVDLISATTTEVVEQRSPEPAEILLAETGPLCSSEPRPTPDALIELALPWTKTSRRPHHANDVQLSLAF